MTTRCARTIAAQHLTIELVDGLEVVQGDFLVERRGDDGLAALYADRTLARRRGSTLLSSR